MTDDLWLKTSIMARRGLAKAHAGKRHELTIEGQGSFRHAGDCYAAQGYGELSGVAIEQRGIVTMQIDAIKGRSFPWPRLETEAFLMTIDSARPLEDAARIACRELDRWMSADLRLRRYRRLPAAQPGRTDPARQHGEMHDGCVNFEKVPGFINHRQPRGGLGP
jgi:hypothetical protein